MQEAIDIQDDWLMTLGNIIVEGDCMQEHQSLAKKVAWSYRAYELCYQQFFPVEEQHDFPNCQLRYWTLGEIVTAFTQAGLTIDQLIELPHEQLADFPGQFIVTALKSC